MRQEGNGHQCWAAPPPGEGRRRPPSRLYSRPKAAAPLATENSSKQMLRDWCWFWCWCWCVLLLVVLDVVLARHRMQMTMT